MAKLSILAGATSQSVNVFIQNSGSTTGAGLTGLVFNTSGLTAYYSFAGANTTSVSISLATLSLVTSAYSSGGFKEIDSTNMPGWYRLDLPNAAIAASKGRSVALHLQGAASMAPCPIEIELTGVDNQDGVHGGMSALPNTACTTNASLLTSGASTDQISVSSGKVILQATQTGVTIPTVTTVTNQLTAAAIATGIWQDTTSGDFTTASSIGKSLYTSGVLPGGAGGLFIAGSNAATSVNITGNLSGSVGSVTGAVGSITSVTFPSGFSTLTTGNIATAVWQDTTGGDFTVTSSIGKSLYTSGNAPGAASGLALVGSAVGASNVIRSGTAQAGGASTITLDAGASATNNLYNNELVYINGGTGVGQVNTVSSYVGSTKVATMIAAWATNPDNTSTFQILPAGPISATVSGGVNVTQWNGTSVAAPNVAGVPLVDIGYTKGTASAGAAGSVGIDWAQVANKTSTVSLTNTTIATVTTVTNQLTAAAIATGIWQDTTSGDFTAASSIGKSLYTSGNAPGAASGIALVGSNMGTASSVTGSVGSVTGLTTATIATAIWTDTTAGDFTTATSPGKIIFTQLGGTFTTTSSSVFSTASLANAPTGGSAPTTAQIATAVWQDTTAGDFTTAGSIGKSLFTSGNAPGAASGLALVGSNMGTASSVTGSVGSVTGAVGSVTGAVGSVTGNVGGNVVGSTASVTGAVGSVTAAVTVSLTQTLSAARALDSIADTSLTLNDAFQCAVASVSAQVDASSGTSCIFKTASTGTTLRTKTLTLITPPTTVPDKAV